MNTKRILIFLIICSILSILPLLHRGFFISDDGEWMVIRFSAFHQALVSGQFPVRFLPRLYFNYGYPVADFLYPGFMYLAEIPKLLKISFVDSIKLILGFSMILSSLFSFLWLSKIFKKSAAFFGALLFLYAPYHFYDLYKRGSVGEILALSVVPFIFWQIERESVFWISLGIAFLILAHNSLALLFLPVVVLYMVLNMLISKKKKHVVGYFSSLFLGVGISAFFSIPALFDLQYTKFSQVKVSNISDHFVNINLIGIASIVIFLLVGILFVTKKIEVGKHRLTVLFFAVGLLSLFFSTFLSSFVWKILPVSFIQFPFRFLSVAILCASFLSTSLLSILPKKQEIIAGAVLVLLAVLTCIPFLQSVNYVQRDEGFYTTNVDSTTVKNEYLPKAVIKNPTAQAESRMEILQAKVESVVISPNKYFADMTSNGKSTIIIHTFYFPGWKATIDGKEYRINTDEFGQMNIAIPAGRHFVTVLFSETPLRLVADLISLASFFALIIFQMRFRKLYEK